MRRNIHPLTPVLIIDILYQLPQSTTIHSILPVQFTCFTVYLHNLSQSPLWSSPWSGTIHFVLHTLFHPINSRKKLNKVRYTQFRAGQNTNGAVQTVVSEATEWIGAGKLESPWFSSRATMGFSQNRQKSLGSTPPPPLDTSSHQTSASTKLLRAVKMQKQIYRSVLDISKLFSGQSPQTCILGTGLGVLPRPHFHKPHYKIRGLTVECR